MCRVRHRNCGVLSGVRQYIVSHYESSINLMRNAKQRNKQQACSVLLQESGEFNDFKDCCNLKN